MVRLTLSTYLDSYTTDAISIWYRLSLTPLLLGIAACASFLIFAGQAGLVTSVHFFVHAFTNSFVVFAVAAAITFGTAGIFLSRTLYELALFIHFTIQSREHAPTKLGMILVFLLDSLLSDTFLFASTIILATTYTRTLVEQTLAFTTAPLILACATIGIFFQLIFLTAYGQSRAFSKVISASKTALGPWETPKKHPRTLAAIYHTAKLIIPAMTTLLLNEYAPHPAYLVILFVYGGVLALATIVRIPLAEHRIQQLGRTIQGLAAILLMFIMDTPYLLGMASVLALLGHVLDRR